MLYLFLWLEYVETKLYHICKYTLKIQYIHNEIMQAPLA